ncbi:DUF3102 domain-containing protein [Bordetella pseudohinzii]|uniref:DUF3102 domain-containing protein n=1 Tax=Bordetella pseudohinzii TaxID=1331258 RepID=A0A0J6C2A1_9BORD|nr:DUF3102 domain-containing protein [Bordetella pseudohinzii]ANY15923.1 DUF3102 domain-containing protein [Bordetella pseudohinzii]KMM25163.1 phage protein [Bordetella pseudohinzii]KXA75907.1 hypothetical protein AW877_18525 [Bordetella pseudohinzii]KXA78971.1 hypothetical protein AW878_11485 [Bordetella pseudohinzii]CUI46176.1 Uncharacterised protein [Bordetella pseudohinzii]
MARTKNILAKDGIEPQIDGDALVAAQAAAAERSALVLQQFGDGLPYERARLVNEARFYMAQSAEAMLEAGKRLILMKEHEPHGDFIQIVEDQLGIGARVAQHMMRAALKYLSPQLESKAKALSLLGKTKLLELVTESDEDLAALADGGTIAGLTLDEIDTMTSRELKAALREARDEGKAKDQLLADKNTKLDKMQADLSSLKRRIKATSPDEQAEQLRREFTAEAHAVEHSIRQALKDGIEKLQQHAAEAGQADTSHNTFIAASLATVRQALADLHAEFGLAEVAVSEDTPAWVNGE